MSAIPPLSGEERTSGQRVENDVNDPELPWCDCATAMWQRPIDIAWLQADASPIRDASLGRAIATGATSHKQGASFRSYL
jgi:hypothetical protein